MSYLITPTLLNSFNYFLKSESETALADFERVIKKESLKSANMEAGNIWENQVCSKMEHTNPLITEIQNKVKNCDYQVSLQKNIKVGNKSILLYGKADCISYDVIYDIKTTSGEYEVGKYLDSMQHRLYMLCSGMKKFEYLITKIKINGDLESKIEVEPLANFGEYYGWQDRFESDIYNCINNFFEFLEYDKEIKEVYNEKWKSL
jgi:hypothetical protein